MFADQLWFLGADEMAQGADLTFNVCDCKLTGIIDKVSISAQAVSGGRAGSKTPSAVQDLIANNPLTTGRKKSGDKAGGVLPLTLYKLKTHEDKKNRPNWIRLIAVDQREMMGRDGMAIHGRGPRGSDGCIVPTDFNIVQLLYKLVLQREEKGLDALTLSVVAIGDIDFYINRMRKIAATA